MDSETNFSFTKKYTIKLYRNPSSDVDYAEVGFFILQFVMNIYLTNNIICYILNKNKNNCYKTVCAGGIVYVKVSRWL
ncbi:hypothetical protein LSPH26S_02544 [Lysinibacillus sphaericus]|nr:hypothetical protein LSP03_15610 [Lysinibacillus sphaericus]